MRAVVQRVKHASVAVSGSIVGRIDTGLLVYLGACRTDTDKDLAYVLNKTIGLRVFANAEGKMDKSVVDVGGSLLVVSQFTLYGDMRRGLRPSFDEAMRPEDAEPLIERFVREARQKVPVETGRFRADMQVTSENDGPVTIWIDSARSA